MKKALLFPFFIKSANRTVTTRTIRAFLIETHFGVFHAVICRKSKNKNRYYGKHRPFTQKTENYGIGFFQVLNCGKKFKKTMRRTYTVRYEHVVHTLNFILFYIYLKVYYKLAYDFYPSNTKLHNSENSLN